MSFNNQSTISFATQNPRGRGTCNITEGGYKGFLGVGNLHPWYTVYFWVKRSVTCFLGLKKNICFWGFARFCCDRWGDEEALMDIPISLGY